MDILKLEKLATALHSCSAVDFNKQFLNHTSIHDLIEIIEWNKDQRASFRAAWALEHILLQEHYLCLQHTDDIIQIFIHASNWSVLRSMSKLIIAITKSSSSKIEQQNNTLGYMLDKGFDLLNNRLCPIALRCNLYDIIFLISQNDRWLLKELKNQILFDLEKQATPALISRGNKLLKKLNNYF